MSFDLDKILEGKRALRRALATRPITEKLRMLDALRERALALRAASVPGPTETGVLRQPQAWKGVPSCECPMPDATQLCSESGQAVAYWRAHVPQDRCFDPKIECLVVLMLNAHRHITGHYFVSTGTRDLIPVNAGEVFRPAILAGASALILTRSHPSGEPALTQSDIDMARGLIRAGQLLRVEVIDHIILGECSYSSLKDLGYLA